jgi:hypothetical protein
MGILDEIDAAGYDVRRLEPVKVQDTGLLTDASLEGDDTYIARRRKGPEPIGRKLVVRLPHDLIAALDAKRAPLDLNRCEAIRRLLQRAIDLGVALDD